MNRLDPKLAALLHESIEAAVGPGECAYVTYEVVEDKTAAVPGCVMGQLCFRLGTSLEDMLEWKRRGIGAVLEDLPLPKTHLLYGVREDFLITLQNQWDRALVAEVPKIKRQMHEMVEMAERGEYRNKS